MTQPQIASDSSDMERSAGVILMHLSERAANLQASRCINSNHTEHYTNI